MKGAVRTTVWVLLLFAGPTSALELPESPLRLMSAAVVNATRDLEILFYSTDVFLPEEIKAALAEIRAAAVAPVSAAAAVCLVMSIMLVVETVYLNAISIFVRLLRRKPERQYKWEALQTDPEVGNLAFPMVLIQIPMYNEKEVYKLSIGAACRLVWPPDRIIIQVLDDSTDYSIREMVELECKSWASQGLNINYELRDGRKGYKAGALKSGMGRSYVRRCEFVAVFDADFRPEPDFLLRTVPFLVYNPKIALVQARWDFAMI